MSPVLEMIMAVTIASVGSSGLWAFVQARVAAKEVREKEEEESKYADKETQDIIKSGQMLMLQDRLHTLISDALEQGYVTEYQLQLITNLHEIYNKEGGNSFIDNLYERIDELDIR